MYYYIFGMIYFCYKKTNDFDFSLSEKLIKNDVVVKIHFVGDTFLFSVLFNTSTVKLRRLKITN